MLVGPGRGEGAKQSEAQSSQGQSGHTHHGLLSACPLTVPPPIHRRHQLLGGQDKTRPLAKEATLARSRPQTGSPGGAGGRRRSYIDSASPPPTPTPPPSPTPPAITTNLCIRVKHCTVYWNELSTTLLNLLVTVYDTVSDVVESKVHQCQQNSDA